MGVTTTIANIVKTAKKVNPSLDRFEDLFMSDG